MISIATDGTTPMEYYKDILDIYKGNVHTELKHHKEIKFDKKIGLALDLWEQGDYLTAKNLFYEVLDEVKKSEMLIDKYTIGMIENNLANCYVKQQDEEEYKNYYLLESAEDYYKKSLYHLGNLTKPKGIIFFNYGVFCLKLNIWKDDPSYIQSAQTQNNFKLIQQINKFTYTKRRSLHMYRFFILSQKYKFRSDFAVRILGSLGDRLF